MGDLEIDTRVERHDDRYTALLSRDWEIWGPNGGYVASAVRRVSPRIISASPNSTGSKSK